MCWGQWQVWEYVHTQECYASTESPDFRAESVFEWCGTAFATQAGDVGFETNSTS